MGNYTKCTLDLKLKADVRPEVVSFLKWLIEDGWPNTSRFICGQEEDRGSHAFDNNPPFPDDHPYFKLGRYYTIGTDYCRLEENYPGYKPSKIEEVDGRWHVRLYTYVKDYGRPIEQFNEWISPYCELEEGAVLGEYYSDDDHWDTQREMKVENGKIAIVSLPREPENRYGGFF